MCTVRNKTSILIYYISFRHKLSSVMDYKAQSTAEWVGNETVVQMNWEIIALTRAAKYIFLVFALCFCLRRSTIS